MRREPHENVATVLVDPVLLPDLELELVELDLWVWPVRSAPICVDGPRTEFQVRRRLLEAQRGAWDCAAAWVPVWISFGERWVSGDDPPAVVRAPRAVAGARRPRRPGPLPPPPRRGAAAGGARRTASRELSHRDGPCPVSRTRSSLRG